MVLPTKDRVRSRVAWHDTLPRGGGGNVSGLEWAEEAGDVGLERPALVLALDEALNKLDRQAPLMARLIELHYFGGLTAEESRVVVGRWGRTLASEAQSFRIIRPGRLDVVLHACCKLDSLRTPQRAGAHVRGSWLPGGAQARARVRERVLRGSGARARPECVLGLRGPLGRGSQAEQGDRLRSAKLQQLPLDLQLSHHERLPFTPIAVPHRQQY